MLNTISDVTPAADPRYSFGMGVFPLFSAPARVPGSTGAAACHGAYWATDVLGRQRFAVGSDLMLGQQNLNKQHDAFTTRIPAASGGVLGSHPEREPEPV